MAKSVGGITYKTINGKRYAYYQWMEDGKQRSRRVKDDELSTLLAEIEQRRAAKSVAASLRMACCFAIMGLLISRVESLLPGRMEWWGSYSRRM